MSSRNKKNNLYEKILALTFGGLAFILSTIINQGAALTALATGTDSASASTNVTLNLGSAISVRVLDSTGSYDITKLSFDFTPTSSGVTNTSRAVVEVGTSNTTGYKLYVESNYQDASGNYTTSLVNGDSDIPSNIGTINTSTTASGSYWNYINPMLSTTSVIPAHGTPDKIAQGFTPVDSAKTNIDINVGVDTTIAAGTYNNQLLFTAIANANPINYNLYFNQNLPTGADPSTLANFPSNQQGSSTATSYQFTIPATAPTLTGYTFINYVDVATESETTPTTYHPGDTVEVLADTSSSTSTNDGEKTLKANWIEKGTLTVNPSGGTWSDGTTPASSSAQVFTADSGTTKTIPDPTKNATYTVHYHANEQGASYDNIYVFLDRAFTSWTLTQDSVGTLGTPVNGSFNPTTKTYTFGTGSDTLTANYNASAAYTLQSISKTGHTCKWAEGSASGTQYSGGTARTITADTNYYAVCTPNTYTISIANSNTTSSPASSITIAYGGTATITVTPSSGYYLSNVSCPTGYTCSGYNTGTDATGTQTVTITNNGTEAGGTLSFEGASTTPPFWTITTMQEMTPEICNSVYTPNNGTGSNITLVDNAYDYYTTYGVSADGTRYVPQRTLYDIRGADGTGTSLNPVPNDSPNAKSYTVRKLADGNCWMSEELYLPLAVGASVEASYNDGTTFTYTPTATGKNANTNTYTWNNTERWYYNWYAATTEKGTSSTGANVDVDGSICPKGWKLPSNYTVTGANPDTGTNWSDMSVSALTQAYLGFVVNTNTSTGYLTLEASPISLLRAGNYNSGSFSNGGSGGYYWSSTASSTSDAYNLGFFSSLVYPQGDNYKASRGFNVRCLAVR